MQVRKVVRKDGHFPYGKSSTRLIRQGLRNIGKKWKIRASIGKKNHFKSRMP